MCTALLFLFCNAVIASDKGIVVGQISFKDDGDLIGQ
jgi:hypothetical protein